MVADQLPSSKGSILYFTRGKRGFSEPLHVVMRSLNCIWLTPVPPIDLRSPTLDCGVMERVQRDASTIEHAPIFRSGLDFAVIATLPTERNDRNLAQLNGLEIETSKADQGLQRIVEVMSYVADTDGVEVFLL